MCIHVCLCLCVCVGSGAGCTGVAVMGWVKRVKYGAVSSSSLCVGCCVAGVGICVACGKGFLQRD